MPQRRKTATEHIEVTDQIGKRHVVLKYTEYLEASPDDEGAINQSEVATEYRMETGRRVTLTGTDTFQTIDGMLRLTTLRAGGAAVASHRIADRLRHLQRAP